jgi:hypothetical protein
MVLMADKPTIPAKLATEHTEAAMNIPFIL